MRRIVAVMLTLLLANVNVARALSCDDETTPQATAAAQHADGSGHEHHAPPSEPEPREHGSTAAQCCQGMTSCAVSVEIEADAARSMANVATAPTSGEPLSAPPSRAAAPETPPPRA